MFTYALAPMHEYTNLPFRILAKNYGAQATFIPLVPCASLLSKEGLEKLRKETSPQERAAIQLFGNNSEYFYRAAKLIEDNFPWINWIDVNAGCPSERALSSGSGAALLYKPKVLESILKSLNKTSFFISVKIRILENYEKTLALVKRIEKYVDQITVHARTLEQGYSGNADWEIIKKINENSLTRICGNGDLKSLDEGFKKIKENYCSCFLIGRAALSNPMLFSGKNFLTKEERKEIFFNYFSLSEKFEMLNLNDLKVKAFEFFKFLPFSSHIRAQISKATSIGDLLSIVEKF